MSDFETWWQQEGQEFLYALNTTTDNDIKLVAEIAWKNGAYCAEQAEQEPVGIVVCDAGGWWGRLSASLPLGAKLYAAPVRTKDLTDDELWTLYKNTEHPIDIMRAVIASDREKNRG